MDNQQPNSQKKLLLIFIGGSVFLLLVIIIVTFILRSTSNSPTPASVTPPQRIQPTLVLISQPLKFINPTSQPLSQVEQIATNFTFVAPTGITASVVDRSASDLAATEISIQNQSKSFLISITDITQKVPSKDLALNPGKQNPHTYAYSPQDFETLAIVDGKELIVSRTGAADMMIVNNKERIFAIPEMAAKTDSNLGKKTEYYVYQKYGTEISEYLSIFQNSTGSYPSYTNYTMVSYSITNQLENANWQADKKTLMTIVSALKKKQ